MLPSADHKRSHLTATLLVPSASSDCQHSALSTSRCCASPSRCLCRRELTRVVYVGPLDLQLPIGPSVPAASILASRPSGAGMAWHGMGGWLGMGYEWEWTRLESGLKSHALHSLSSRSLQAPRADPSRVFNTNTASIIFSTRHNTDSIIYGSRIPERDNGNAMQTPCTRTPDASPPPAPGLWRRRPADFQKQRRNPAAFRAADQQIHRRGLGGQRASRRALETKLEGRAWQGPKRWVGGLKVGWPSGASPLICFWARELHCCTVALLLVGEAQLGTESWLLARHLDTFFCCIQCLLQPAWVLSGGPQALRPSPLPGPTLSDPPMARATRRAAGPT